MNIKEKAKAYSLSIAQNEERQKYCEEDFAKGAKWMQEKMIDKACEWLKSVMLDDDIYGVGNNVENLKELINDFKKAMKNDV